MIVSISHHYPVMMKGIEVFMCQVPVFLLWWPGSGPQPASAKNTVMSPWLAALFFKLRPLKETGTASMQSIESPKVKTQGLKHHQINSNSNHGSQA
jgi:hypothetical protein